MRSFSKLLAIFGLWVLLLAGSIEVCAAEPGSSSGAIQNKLQKIEKSMGIQQNLPSGATTGDGADVRRDASLWEAQSVSSAVVPAAAGIWNLLLWGIAIVVAIGLIAILADAVMNRNASASMASGLAATDGAPLGTAAPEEWQAMLAAADGLAATQRYEEAMHQLLLAALVVLGKKDLPESLTSREILRTVKLPGGALAALRELVVMVELSWFGASKAGLPEFEKARGRFGDFRMAWEANQ